MQDWPDVRGTRMPLEAQLWRVPQETRDREGLRWLEKRLTRVNESGTG
jgi:hypothetical protein